MPTSRIHLCILQPAGHVHALGFIDQARFFRYQFRRLGAEVSIGKNRLRHDAINFVFGSHAGFDESLKARFRCVFVNLEQLGAGGAAVAPAYLHLLATSAVVDYDSANVQAYRGADLTVGLTANLTAGRSAEVPLVSFGHAPYLHDEHVLPLEQRPIDVLFYGSTNERRLQLLRQIEATGCKVGMLKFGIFGPERDEEIRRAKAVFNCHFYDTARFEQARAFQCLSLGTPMVSERTPFTTSPAQFDDSVFWVETEHIQSFFAKEFGAADFTARAREKLAAFSAHDVLDQYAAVLDHARNYFGNRTISSAPWQPERLHIGSGRQYMPGWFNVDILAQAEPDALLDLSQPLELPARIESPMLGPVELRAGSLDFVYANNVLEHVGDLPRLMTNCLHLLREGGQMLIEVPYEKSLGAWQDPTHVRAFNENSWTYYAQWFWYLGWFEARFEMVSFDYLDDKLAVCAREAAHFMRVCLQKVATTAEERSTARSVRADFGGLPDDEIA